MSDIYRLTGSNSIFQILLRAICLAAATIGGVFLVIFSAAFALFVIVGRFVFGLIMFTVFWLRAKFSGQAFSSKAFSSKTFSSKAFTSRSQTIFETDDPMSDFDQNSNRKKPQARPVTGPVIDAHKTPHGWSIDD